MGTLLGMARDRRAQSHLPADPLSCCGGDGHGGACTTELCARRTNEVTLDRFCGTCGRLNPIGEVGGYCGACRTPEEWQKGLEEARAALAAGRNATIAYVLGVPEEEIDRVMRED